jgi:predicted nucleic acid-binding Zn ribbon protein
MSRLLGQAVNRSEVLRAAKAQKILRNWPDIVGEQMASRSQPDRYDRGTVWIAVNGSAWAQELRMASETILERLRVDSGDPTLFRSLRFGVRARHVPIVVPVAKPEAPKTDYGAMTIQEIRARRMKAWQDAGGTD